jgi:hypothetical protein
LSHELDCGAADQYDWISDDPYLSLWFKIRSSFNGTGAFVTQKLVLGRDLKADLETASICSAFEHLLLLTGHEHRVFLGNGGK